MKQVGVLNELNVKGNVALSQHLFWNADADRLGLGTDAPNGAIGVMGFDSEFIIDVDQPEVRIGTYTVHDLHVVTDDTSRIVWNDDPKPTSYVGWVCVREGTPGEWKAFGQISS